MNARVAEVDSNAGILRYLAEGQDPRSVRVERPTPQTDTLRLGAHPDVVERLWTTLNGALPADSRLLVAGGAALARPSSGVILALALGTQYALRLTPAGFDEAVAGGHATVHTFATVGRTLDLAQAFGTGWAFGRYDDRELGWLADAYHEVTE